ncbi:MAG TPA: acyl carrier protein [Chitinophagaceae bacterium]|nr:acyl carrier protein [Chitinophagaceae bacterium]
MTNKEILEQVEQVLKEELDNADIVVTPKTVADDIEEWDSLANIQVIIGLERKFGIKFTAWQVNGFKNVGEICECIQSAQG